MATGGLEFTTEPDMVQLITSASKVAGSLHALSERVLQLGIPPAFSPGRHWGSGLVPSCRSSGYRSRWRCSWADQLLPRLECCQRLPMPSRRLAHRIPMPSRRFAHRLPMPSRSLRARCSENLGGRASVRNDGGFELRSTPPSLSSLRWSCMPGPCRQPVPLRSCACSSGRTA